MSEYGIKLKGLKPCPFCGGKAKAFEKGRPVEGLAYTEALEQRNLFALKSDNEGLQEVNRFSNYTLFKSRKENEA